MKVVIMQFSPSSSYIFFHLTEYKLQ